MNKSNLLEQYISTITNGVIQHSADWLSKKTTTIGGSSLATVIGDNYHSTLRELLLQRAGLTKFNGNVATQWGNIFENVIKTVVEKQLKCKILGDDLYICPNYINEENKCALNINDSIENINNCLSFSPDGLAAVTTDKEEIVLFEFKCPYSRIPSLNQPPKCYIPQVKMGMDIIDIVDKGMLVEAVFRRCSWEHLGYNKNCDEIGKIPKYRHGLPISYGLIGFYMKNTVTLPEEMNGVELCDLGSISLELFSNLINLSMEQKIHIWYGDCLYETNTDDDIDAQIDNFTEFCIENNYKKIGLLPWKLFEIVYHNISKESNYLLTYVEKIYKIVNCIKVISDMPDESKIKYINEFIQTI